MEDKLMVLFVQMAYVVANMDGVAPDDAIAWGPQIKKTPFLNKKNYIYIYIYIKYIYLYILITKKN